MGEFLLFFFKEKKKIKIFFFSERQQNLNFIFEIYSWSKKEKNEKRRSYLLK